MDQAKENPSSFGRLRWVSPRINPTLRASDGSAGFGMGRPGSFGSAHLSGWLSSVRCGGRRRLAIAALAVPPGAAAWR
jgi:hypothetical protein